MTTLTNIYEGGLRTRLTHTRSGQVVVTDAPVDNQGRGEAFSPTDLACAALCSCMLTTMGIYAQREQIDMIGMTAEVVKIMASNPRRIAEVQVTLSHTNLQATPEQKERLKQIGESCPVSLSLHPEVKQTLVFNF
jgi:uncharacterized OsmC-like protein